MAACSQGGHGHPSVQVAGSGDGDRVKPAAAQHRSERRIAAHSIYLLGLPPSRWYDVLHSRELETGALRDLLAVALPSNAAEPGDADTYPVQWNLLLRVPASRAWLRGDVRVHHMQCCIAAGIASMWRSYALARPPPAPDTADSLPISAARRRAQQGISPRRQSSRTCPRRTAVDGKERRPALCLSRSRGPVGHLGSTAGSGSTARSRDSWPIVPRVKLSSLDEFLTVAERDARDLPAVNTEPHVVCEGCTSQSCIGAGNRVSEIRLPENHRGRSAPASDYLRPQTDAGLFSCGRCQGPSGRGSPRHAPRGGEGRGCLRAWAGTSLSVHGTSAVAGIRCVPWSEETRPARGPG